MIYHTGDLHGEWDISKLSNSKTKFITKDDLLIVSGDFGLVWNFKYEKSCKHWRDWLDEKPYDTLFCDGNHENFDRLLSDEFPFVEKFGGIVKQISKKIFELQTGHIYTIQGKKVFVFGGAQSIDKFDRVSHIDWWSQEIPSASIFFKGMRTLEEHGNKVDLVISHATHRDCFEKAVGFMPTIAMKEEDPLLGMLQTIKETIQYDLWVCGHYHLNCFDGKNKTAMLYNLIVSYDRLKEIVDRDKDTIGLFRLF